MKRVKWERTRQKKLTNLGNLGIKKQKVGEVKNKLSLVLLKLYKIGFTLKQKLLLGMLLNSLKKKHFPKLYLMRV